MNIPVEILCKYKFHFGGTVMVASLVYLETEQLFSRLAVLFSIFTNNAMIQFLLVLAFGVTFFLVAIL